MGGIRGVVRIWGETDEKGREEGHRMMGRGGEVVSVERNIETTQNLHVDAFPEADAS